MTGLIALIAVVAALVLGALYADTLVLLNLARVDRDRFNREADTLQDENDDLRRRLILLHVAAASPSPGKAPLVALPPRREASDD